MTTADKVGRSGGKCRVAGERLVDRVKRPSSRQRVEDLLGYLCPSASLGLTRRRSQVRRQHGSRRVEQRRPGRRLVLEDVDRRTRQAPVTERGGKCLLVD